MQNIGYCYGTDQRGQGHITPLPLLIEAEDRFAAMMRAAALPPPPATFAGAPTAPPITS